MKASSVWQSDEFNAVAVDLIARREGILTFDVPPNVGRSISRYYFGGDVRWTAGPWSFQPTLMFLMGSQEVPRRGSTVPRCERAVSTGAATRTPIAIADRFRAWRALRLRRRLLRPRRTATTSARSPSLRSRPLRIGARFVGHAISLA